MERQGEELASLESERFLTGVTQAGRERGSLEQELLEETREQTKIARETADAATRTADALEDGQPIAVGLEDEG